MKVNVFILHEFVQPQDVVVAQVVNKLARQSLTETFPVTRPWIIAELADRYVQRTIYITAIITNVELKNRQGGSLCYYQTGDHL